MKSQFGLRWRIGLALTGLWMLPFIGATSVVMWVGKKRCEENWR